MSDDSGFIRAILFDADPNLRLIYADWLEERSDPRCELIRIDVELRCTPNEELKKRFDELRLSASLVWQALVLDHDLEPRSARPANPGGTGPVRCPNRICHWGNPASVRHCQSCRFPLPLPTGSVVVGRYRLAGGVILGAFGYVYEGKDLQTGQSIMVKELVTDNIEDFSCLVPFFREEADLLSFLQPEPMVPRLVEYREENCTAYRIEEYLGDDAIALGRTFPFDWVVNLGKRLCDLLERLHSQIPPLHFADLLCHDHLYLAPDQQTVKVQPELRCTAQRVKYEIHRLHRRLEGRGARMGCCGLSVDPPERIIGMPETRSDLFSLAGVLYELLTGQTAEGGYTRLQLFDSLAAVPEKERWLYELIAVNLSEAVCDRYYSARAVRADLERRAVTRRVSCPNCGQGNPVRQPHCSRCSQALTDWVSRPCRNCGERYRMGARSCPKCGKEVWG